MTKQQAIKELNETLEYSRDGAYNAGISRELEYIRRIDEPLIVKRSAKERYEYFRTQVIKCWAVAKELEEEDCTERLSEIIQYCDEALENIKKELRE